MKIKSIKKCESEKVYDITVKDEAHYILENGVVSHNSGLYYAATNIIFLSKRKEKLGTEVIGNIIHCKNQKSRLTIENKMIDALVTYDKGLDRYYGLLELAEACEIFKKVSTRYELPDGTKQFGKPILAEPEKYFTDDVLEKINDFCQTEFLYGKSNQTFDEQLEEENVRSEE